MTFEFWRPMMTRAKAALPPWAARWLDSLVQFLSMPAPESSQLLRRIEIMERDIILPLKAVGICMLWYSFYKRPWIGNVLGSLEVAVEWTQFILWVYVGANVIIATGLLAMRRLHLELVQWIVFASCLMDGLFLSVLTLVTGGYDSFLYWFFLPLIVRSAVSVPRATSQLMLNMTLSICYVIAGRIELAIAQHVEAAQSFEKDISPGASLPGPVENPTETLALRFVVLLLMTVCSYGVQLLLERQRRAMEEAREFAVREGQLKSAGRMAAEFVHQIKNPLAIINTAAWSLQRAAREGRANGSDQIQIIKEEVEKSDRIITQVMGYAQLSEGRVEKLDVIDELEHALKEVFPPGAIYPIKVHKQYGESFPPLLMQRRHLRDSLINLLQNARDILEVPGGNIYITAIRRGDVSIEISIRDDGPGIPPEKHEQIFEAYYTTREKGTGLGLAAVKHNVELYGGKVRVESELGKGACFILLFPARSLLELPATS